MEQNNIAYSPSPQAKPKHDWWYVRIIGEVLGIIGIIFLINTLFAYLHILALRMILVPYSFMAATVGVVGIATAIALRGKQEDLAKKFNVVQILFTSLVVAGFVIYQILYYTRHTELLNLQSSHRLLNDLFFYVSYITVYILILVKVPKGYARTAALTAFVGLGPMMFVVSVALISIAFSICLLVLFFKSLPIIVAILGVVLSIVVPFISFSTSSFNKRH